MTDNSTSITSRPPIPAAPPPDREIALSSAGMYTCTVPSGAYAKSWAKRLARIDSGQRGGYALVGDWLKSDTTIAVTLGEVIGVGSKQNVKHRFVSDFRLYVATPIQLVGLHTDTGVNVVAAAELLALSSGERVEKALKRLLATCDDMLVRIAEYELDACEDELTLINERSWEWTTLRQKTIKALIGIDPEANITDIDSAALAIVTAGYRDLAKRYHPDMANGSHDIMALLTTAKKQLVEILESIKGA